MEKRDFGLSLNYLLWMKTTATLCMTQVDQGRYNYAKGDQNWTNQSEKSIKILLKLSRTLKQSQK